MSKVLISYFSATGNTKKVAEKVAKAVGADLFEIEPTEKYTKADLNWLNPKSRTTVEMKENVKPNIVRTVPNLNDYDTVCLAFPIWWYKEPTIIDKFLEENDMTNKKLYIFVTSGSSKIDSTYENLTSNFSNLNFIDGKRFNGKESEEEYKSWIE